MTNITAGTRTPGQALASESALYAIHSLGFVSLFCYVLCNSRGGGGARGRGTWYARLAPIEDEKDEMEVHKFLTSSSMISLLSLP